MIGYDDAACAITRDYFGQANDSAPFWMDNTRCTGSEEVLDDCSFSGWGVHRCDHITNDAGIVHVNSKLHLPVDKFIVIVSVVRYRVYMFITLGYRDTNTGVLLPMNK